MNFEEKLSLLGLRWEGYLQWIRIDDFIEEFILKERTKGKEDAVLFNQCAELVLAKKGTLRIQDPARLPSALKKELGLKGIKPLLLKYLYFQYDSMKEKIVVKLFPIIPYQAVLECVEPDKNKEFVPTKEEKMKMMFQIEQTEKRECIFCSRVESSLQKEVVKLNQKEEIQVYLSRIEKTFLKKMEHVLNQNY